MLKGHVFGWKNGSNPKQRKASNRRIGYHVALRFDAIPHSVAMACVIWDKYQVT